MDVVVTYQEKYSYQEAYKQDFPVKMAHILCILALLCFASSVVENTETMLGFKDLQLQQDSLPWINKLQDKQVRCLYFRDTFSILIPVGLTLLTLSTTQNTILPFSGWKQASGPSYHNTAYIRISCVQLFHFKVCGCLCTHISFISIC